MPHLPFSPLRRALLLGALTLPVSIALPAPVRAAMRRAFPTRTVEQDLPAFSARTGLLEFPDGTDAPYVLRIDGLVQAPAALAYADLTALPQVEQTSDMHCVEGWSVQNIMWGGVRLKTLLDLAQADKAARYVVFHALGATPRGPDGLRAYVECMSIADLTDPAQDCLLALRIGGAPLPHDRGAPARLVAPYQLAYKSIKFVHRLEVTREARDGWWTAANPIYPRNAPVPKRRLRAP
ncbi:molybdopterin-dependent oxidoreductase [Desulfobaculum sp.]